MSLLLADSRFPGGGHVHSGGLEEAAARGLIRTEADLPTFLRNRLRTAGALAATFAAAAAHPTADWQALDEELDARTPSPAQRTASRAQGKATARAARAMLPMLAAPPGSAAPPTLAALPGSAGLPALAAPAGSGGVGPSAASSDSAGLPGLAAPAGSGGPPTFAVSAESGGFTTLAASTGQGGSVEAGGLAVRGGSEKLTTLAEAVGSAGPAGSAEAAGRGRLAGAGSSAGAGRSSEPTVALEALAGLLSAASRPHHSVVLGAVVGAGGGSPGEAALAAAYLAVSGPASASVRLLGLDPLRVNAVVAALGPEVAAVAREAAAVAHLPAAELPAPGSPGLDLLAEEHDRHHREEVRLFAS